jgi:hypothetical protein
MSDRRNRLFMVAVALVLLVGGGLAVLQGAAVFGDQRSTAHIFSVTVVRWWREGGWMSFAVVGGIGGVAFVLGVVLVLRELRRNDGRDRTPEVRFDVDGARGETTLRAAALSHAVEADLERLANVRSAMVGLFGHAPSVELRMLIEVGDHIDVEGLPGQVDGVLRRFRRTSGLEPTPVRITVRFAAGKRERQLE